LKLILVRHGQTEGNAAGIHQGQIHGKLSAKGIAQAKKLALRLKDEKIDAIFTSDLARASDTVAEVAKYHNVKVIPCKEIRERTSGVFDGVTREEYHAAVKASGKSRVEFRPENGENYVDLRERVKKFLGLLMRDYDEKTVLVCSHWGVNVVILGLAMNKTLEESVETFKQENTCVNVIEFSKGETAVRVLNCAKHLE